MPEPHQETANQDRVPFGARWTSFFSQREEQVFLLLTLVIGAIVGAAVVAFILLTQRFGARIYAGHEGASWPRFVIPVAGSLAMGSLLFRFFPDARGSGVPQTKAALYAREGRISLSTVFGKFFCTSATLACGIPLGREGPSVQVGAGIASVLGRKLGLRPEKVKALIPVGAAAAVAAAFNTPLAGIVFGVLGTLGLLAVARRRRLLDTGLWLVAPALVVSYFAAHNFKVFHPRYLAVSMPGAFSFLTSQRDRGTEVESLGSLVFHVARQFGWDGRRITIPNGPCA